MVWFAGWAGGFFFGGSQWIFSAASGGDGARRQFHHHRRERCVVKSLRAASGPALHAWRQARLYLAGDDVLTNVTAQMNRFFWWGHQPLPGNFGFVAGQDMFTPENILDPAPINNDRPYAGWLYAGMVYQRRNESSAHFATMENFEVNVGLVGPDSMADDTQILIHRWRFPEDIPQGWHNQIHEEPGLVLKYAHLWRYSLNDTTARFFDVIPRTGFELGNVAIFATAGVTARLGFNLPPDFGMQIIDSPASASGGKNARTPIFACYTFAGVDGRYVVRDLALDGNTFRHSQSVEKYNFVND